MHKLVWLVVAVQVAFGALEVFRPRIVFCLVLDAYKGSEANPVWTEAEKITRNIGLYNWFLALGLGLALRDWLGGSLTAQFFLACIALAGLFGIFSVAAKPAFIAQLILGVGGIALLRFAP